MLGGGVSHPSQLTTGLVIKSVTTSPTFGRRAYAFYSAGKYSVGTNHYFAHKITMVSKSSRENEE